MARFTIITNTIRRSEDLVIRSIAASLAQAGDDAFVILVDQNPEPLTMPDNITADSRFLWQHEIVASVSAARNRAKLPSDSEWLVFCDDDGYIGDGYLQRFREAIRRNPEVEIFAGSIRRTDTGEFYSRRHAIGGDLNSFWNSKLLMGSNFAVRRETFERLGKFDENFGAGARFGSSEETDFAWNAYFSRVRMMYVPELIVRHVPPFVGDLSHERAKAYRYGVGKGRLVRKWFARGKLIVLWEVAEMLFLPLMMIPWFQWRAPREAELRWLGWKGRLNGLLAREPKTS